MAHAHRRPITCPHCGSDQTIKVTMTLAGSPASFMMCNTCEWKAWEREGESIPLGSVLTLVAGR